MEVNFFFGARAGGELFQVLDKRFQVAEVGYVCACGLRRFVPEGGISFAISWLGRWLQVLAMVGWNRALHGCNGFHGREFPMNQVGPLTDHAGQQTSASCAALWAPMGQSLWATKLPACRPGRLYLRLTSQGFQGRF